MSRKLFGTDGIRGVANQFLTPELVFGLGKAAGQFLIDSPRANRAVIARDTRRSGTMLSAAMAAGLASVGVEVDDLGVAPTPTVTYAARVFDYGVGVVISASHNPAPDNGIKLIGHDGRKLSDDEEQTIELLLEVNTFAQPVGSEIGSISNDQSVVDAYLNFLESLLPERLDGMKIAIDAAHGAAYQLAPEILVRLGAEVLVSGAEPDGNNINADGGATKPSAIQEFVVDCSCDLGVAFDGDADRAVFCDAKGTLVNGDRTMGIWASYWKNQGRLNPQIVVGTVMSNQGFEKYLNSEGISLERSPVGDKYVSQRIDATGSKIGGEQSGHIIFPANGPTGDGLATMLELLRILKREKRSLSTFIDDYEPTPQVLYNVSVASKDGWNESKRIFDAIQLGERTLEGNGRVNVRPSGTQPMIRVMVEAESYEQRDRVADSIVNALISELGGEIYSKVDLTHALGD